MPRLIVRDAPRGLLVGALLAAALAGPAQANPQAKSQMKGSPLLSLLEQGQGRLLWIYDGIRHVALPLAGGKAVIGLNCERQMWTLFTIERNGRDLYSFREDPGWQYLPAGPIADSKLCSQPVRVAE